MSDVLFEDGTQLALIDLYEVWIDAEGLLPYQWFALVLVFQAFKSLVLFFTC